MISGQKREEIVAVVISKIPESLEMEKQYKNLLSDITNACSDMLTEDEREFINKFPDFLLHQGEVSLNGEEINNIEDENFPTIQYSWNIYSKFYSVTIGSGKEPFLFKSWKDLKKFYPDLYNTWKEKLRNIIKLWNIIIKKREELIEILSDSDIALRDIKKYYPELYKIIKDAK